jgi:hypothetical protein
VVTVSPWVHLMVLSRQAALRVRSLHTVAVTMTAALSRRLIALSLCWLLYKQASWFFCSAILLMKTKSCLYCFCISWNATFRCYRHPGRTSPWDAPQCLPFFLLGQLPLLATVPAFLTGL